MKKTRRAFSLFLAILMCVGLLPTGVLADEEVPIPDEGGMIVQLVEAGEGEGDDAAIEPAPEENPAAEEPAAVSPAALPGPPLHLVMNGAELDLPGKASGDPYYLMDLLEYSGIDFNHLDKPVELLVNGGFGQFSQRLYENDDVVIRQGERQ